MRHQREVCCLTRRSSYGILKKKKKCKVLKILIIYIFLINVCMDGFSQ